MCSVGAALLEQDDPVALEGLGPVPFRNSARNSAPGSERASKMRKRPAATCCHGEPSDVGATGFEPATS